MSAGSGVVERLKALVTQITSTDGSVTITPSGGSGVVNLSVTNGGGGTPGGSDTQLQYNNAGTFGGMDITIYDTTTSDHALTLYNSQYPLFVYGTASDSSIAFGNGGYFQSGEVGMYAPASGLPFFAYVDATAATYFSSNIKVDYSGGIAMTSIGSIVGIDTSGQQVIIQTDTASKKALTLKGAPSQTANIFEIENFTGTAYAWANATNSFVVKDLIGGGTFNPLIYGIDPTYGRRLGIYSDGNAELGFFADSQLQFQSPGGAYFLNTTSGDTLYVGRESSFTIPTGYFPIYSLGNFQLGFVDSVTDRNILMASAFFSTTTTPAARLHFQSDKTTRITSIFQAIASQTVNITEWRNSGGTAMSAIDTSGNFTGQSATVNTINGKITTSGGITLTGSGTTASPYNLAGSGGTVTSVSVVTANGVSGSVATATTTPAITLTLGNITPSSVTVTNSGTASTSPISSTGALFTGGTATTTFPYELLQPTGTTAVTTWSTNGTWRGVNAASGFNGFFEDYHINGGTSVYSVNSAGSVVSTGSATWGSSSQMRFTARSSLQSPVDGTLLVTNNAVSGFTALQLGGTTSSFPELRVNGTTIEAKLADNSAYTNFTSLGLTLTGLTNGLVKTTSGVLSNATAGTDYLTPTGNGSGLTNLTPANISAGTAGISITGNSATTTTISGQITSGTNVTVTGSGTTASPYNISASGTGGTTNNFNTTRIDQTPASGGSYGTLAGLVNGTNTVFTVSNGSYVSGTGSLNLNGSPQTQGTSYDWVETTPSSGTITLNIAPPTGSILIFEYSVPSTSSGAIPESVVVKTANYTVNGSTDKDVVADTSANDVTLTLPSAAAFGGSVYRFKNTGTTVSFVCKLLPVLSQTIDGSPSRTLLINDEITLQAVAGNWQVMGSYYSATNRSIYGQTTVKTGDTLTASTIGTTETPFASFGILPANSQVVGQAFVFKLQGTYTSTGVGSPTSTARVKMNTTTIVDTGALSALPAGTFGYWGEVTGKIVSVGSSGSIRAGGVLHFATSTTGAVTIVVPVTTTTVDTTVLQNLKLSLQFNAATAGNSNTLLELDIIEIRPPKGAN